MMPDRISCYSLLILFLTFPLTSGFAEEPKPAIRQPDSAKAFYGKLVNTTIIATSSFGNNFREYHAADGRVLGYNYDDVKNYRSCWRVVSHNIICYYYEQPPLSASSYGTNESCWYYEWLNEEEISGYVVGQPDKTMHAYVKQGNPEKLSDFGIKWTCGQQIIAWHLKH